MLAWEPSPSAASYSVARGTSASGPFATIASGVTGTSYADSGLTNGTGYFYTVAATNAAGTSAATTRARVTPVAAPGAGTVRWPLSSSTAPDAAASAPMISMAAWTSPHRVARRSTPSWTAW
jgi:cellulose 1,4-beta-cellobiosidase